MPSHGQYGMKQPGQPQPGQPNVIQPLGLQLLAQQVHQEFKDQPPRMCISPDILRVARF